MRAAQPGRDEWGCVFASELRKLRGGDRVRQDPRGEPRVTDTQNFCVPGPSEAGLSSFHSLRGEARVGGVCSE